MTAVKTNNIGTPLDVTEEEIEFVCPSCGFRAAAAPRAKIICRTKNCNVLIVPVTENVTFSQ